MNQSRRQQLVVLLSLSILAVVSLGTLPTAVAVDTRQRPTLAPEPSPGPPRPTLTSGEEPPPAAICARLETARISPDGEVELLLVLQNSGRGTAQDLRATLSYSPARTEVIEVRLSRKGDWVRAVQPGLIELQLGALGNKETLAITMSFVASPEPLKAQATLTWAGTRDRPLHSNPVLVRSPEGSNEGTLILRPAAGGSGLVVSAQAFAGGELISLWWQRSDGSAAALASSHADRVGQLWLVIPGVPPPLATAVVAYGECSGVTARGPVGP